MTPLVVLLVVYAVLTGLDRWVPAVSISRRWRGTIAMATLFLFTGASHFALSRYLLFRVPLQAFFMLWLWWFALRDRDAPS